VVLQRGEVILSGSGETMDQDGVQRHLAV